MKPSSSTKLSLADWIDKRARLLQNRDRESTGRPRSARNKTIALEGSGGLLDRLHQLRTARQPLPLTSTGNTATLSDVNAHERIPISRQRRNRGTQKRTDRGSGASKAPLAPISLISSQRLSHTSSSVITFLGTQPSLFSGFGQRQTAIGTDTKYSRRYTSKKSHKPTRNVSDADRTVLLWWRGLHTAQTIPGTSESENATDSEVCHASPVFEGRNRSSQKRKRSSSSQPPSQLFKDPETSTIVSTGSIKEFYVPSFTFLNRAGAEPDWTTTAYCWLPATDSCSQITKPESIRWGRGHSHDGQYLRFLNKSSDINCIINNFKSREEDGDGGGGDVAVLRTTPTKVFSVSFQPSNISHLEKFFRLDRQFFYTGCDPVDWQMDLASSCTWSCAVDHIFLCRYINGGLIRELLRLELPARSEKVIDLARVMHIHLKCISQLSLEDMHKKLFGTCGGDIMVACMIDAYWSVLESLHRMEYIIGGSDAAKIVRDLFSKCSLIVVQCLTEAFIISKNSLYKPKNASVKEGDDQMHPSDVLKSAWGLVFQLLLYRGNEDSKLNVSEILVSVFRNILLIDTTPGNNIPRQIEIGTKVLLRDKTFESCWKLVEYLLNYVKPIGDKPYPVSLWRIPMFLLKLSSASNSATNESPKQTTSWLINRCLAIAGKQHDSDEAKVLLGYYKEICMFFWNYFKKRNLDEKQVGDIHLFLTLLRQQLNSASTLEVSSTLRAIGMNLPAIPRVVTNNQSEESGVCRTHSSLHNTGEVLLIVGRAAMGVHNVNCDASSQKIMKDVSTYLINRLDFVQSDSKARDIYIRQLFSLVRTAQSRAIPVPEAITVISDCMGTLCLRYNELVVEMQKPAIPPMFEAQVRDNRESYQHGMKAKKAFKEELKMLCRLLHRYVTEEFDHTIFNDTTKRNGFICGELQLIVHSGTSNALAAIVATHPSSTDLAKKSAVRCLGRLFQCLQREAQEVLDHMQSANHAATIDSKDMDDNDDDDDDDDDDGIDSIMANIDMDGTEASYNQHAASETTSAKSNQLRAEAAGAFVTSSTKLLMEILNDIINSRLSRTVKHDRCSFDLWCLSVECFALGCIRRCLSLREMPTPLWIDYGPGTLWHAIENKQKRQLPVKMLGILVSSTEVCEMLPRHYDIVNLWIQALLDWSVPDRDINQFAVFIGRVVCKSTEDYISSLTVPEPEKVGSVEKNDAALLLVLTRFTSMMGTQKPTFDVVNSIFLNIDKVIKRCRKELSGDHVQAYVDFSAKAVSCIVEQLTPFIYRANNACIFANLVSEFLDKKEYAGSINTLITSFLSGIGQLDFNRDPYLRRILFNTIFKRWFETLSCPACAVADGTNRGSLGDRIMAIALALKAHNMKGLRDFIVEVVLYRYLIPDHSQHLPTFLRLMEHAMLTIKMIFKVSLSGAVAEKNMTSLESLMQRLYDPLLKILEHFDFGSTERLMVYRLITDLLRILCDCRSKFDLVHDMKWNSTMCLFSECILEHALHDLKCIVLRTPDNPLGGQIQGLLRNTTQIASALRRHLPDSNASYLKLRNDNTTTACAHANRLQEGHSAHSVTLLERHLFRVINTFALMSIECRQLVMNALPRIRDIITGSKPQWRSRKRDIEIEGLASFKAFLRKLGQAGQPYLHWLLLPAHRPSLRRSRELTCFQAN